MASAAITTASQLQNQTSKQRLFPKSSVFLWVIIERRAGYERFLRNVLIAAGNSGDVDLMSLITPFLDHSSALLRAMAIWAVRQLADDDIWQRLRDAYLPDERDQSVRHEWQGN
jgi:hypothetical protein